MILLAITAGTSRVPHVFLCMHVVVTYPGRHDATVRSSFLFHRCQPSPTRGRVGTCIAVFEAYPTFIRITTCMLAESLLRSFTPKAPTTSLPKPLLRLLPGGANQFPRGTHPAERHRLFTAHPLRFAIASPPSGWEQDFHLPAVKHARHTRNARIASGRLC